MNDGAPIDLTLRAAQLDDALIAAVAGCVGTPPTASGPRIARWSSIALDDAQRERIAALADAAGADQAMLAPNARLSDFAVLAMDMDSTLITIECLDEIGDFVGRKDQIAAITEAAMRGEIADYKESLRRRVALLAGLDASALQRVYDERLRLSPGARALVDAAHAAGLATLLVSGGFNYFTHRLQRELGLTRVRSNELEIAGGKMTGRVVGEIVDATGKADALRTLCDELGVPTSRAIAIGDGANDLAMMKLAGLSVAYRAKPIVAAQASCAIRHGGLDAVLDFLGREMIG